MIIKNYLKGSCNLILRYYPGIRLEGLKKTTKISGWPVCGLKFEPRTTSIKSRSVNHSTKTFSLNFSKLNKLHTLLSDSKAKSVPLHATKALGGGYSSYSFSTLALDGGEWSASCPSRTLALGKGPSLPIVHKTGWAPEPVWTHRLEEKSFTSAGN
jgi:hypothetical protein